jgi:peptidoglycan/LPS O-acetylase OafA/YrhL
MTGGNETIKSIQFLRAIAALGVVYFHCTAERGGYHFPNTGAFGVDIFFVISGFIIAWVVSKNTEGFFLKRLIRIWPLYLLATSLMAFAVFLFPQHINTTTVSLPGFLKSVFFIPYRTELRGNPILEVGWTLNFEMFFYLVMSLCILFVKNKKRLTAACAALLILFMSALAVWNSGFYALKVYQTGLFPEFIYGLALFHGYEWYRKRHSRLRSPFAAGAVLLTAFLCIAWLVASDIYGLHPFNRNIYYGVPALLLAVSALLLEGNIRDSGMTRFFLKLGDASYAMYLFHPFSIFFLSRLVFPRLFSNASIPLLELAKLLLAMGLTVVFSLLIYEWIDRPIQKRLRGLLKRRGGAGL